MLDTNPANIALAADVMTQFHINNAVPGNTPDWINISIPNQTLEMQYGYNGTQYGSLRFSRGQFALTNVTNADGAWVPLTSYNHAGSNTTQQNFIDALKCNNLNANQTFVSALIILTSECCRSTMVLNAVRSLMENTVAFDFSVESGLNFAYTNYSKTSTFLHNNIQAGGAPWFPLQSDNYIDYIASPGYTGDRPTQTEYIEAVVEYIATYPV